MDAISKLTLLLGRQGWRGIGDQTTHASARDQSGDKAFPIHRNNGKDSFFPCNPQVDDGEFCLKGGANRATRQV